MLRKEKQRDIIGLLQFQSHGKANESNYVVMEFTAIVVFISMVKKREVI